VLVHPLLAGDITIVAPTLDVAVARDHVLSHLEAFPEIGMLRHAPVRPRRRAAAP
jgi:hypothetical protein